MNENILTVGFIVCVHDRVAEMDSYPRIFPNKAQAMRQFKQEINLPSDYMTFHAPRDFELVCVGAFTRSEAGHIMISSGAREVILTGTAAVDEQMRETYLRMSKTVSTQEENIHHAS